jgi:excisionase family DNA binding protein
MKPGGWSAGSVNGREALLRSLAPEVVTALEQLIDERLAAAASPSDGKGSPWLEVRDAADYLHVSERTIARMVKRGRVRSTTLGRRRLFHRDDLNAVAATGEETAPTAPPRRRQE